MNAIKILKFSEGQHLGIIASWDDDDSGGPRTLIRDIGGEEISKIWTQIEILQKWLKSFGFFGHALPPLEEIPRILDHLVAVKQPIGFFITHEWHGRPGDWISSFGPLINPQLLLSLVAVVPLPPKSQPEPEPEPEPEPVITYSKRPELYDDRSGMYLYRMYVDGRRQGIGELRGSDGTILGYVRNSRRTVIYRTFEAAKETTTNGHKIKAAA